MKIALLNLPLDNNYGGNLQRYALMKILQDMGHEVKHICLVRRFLPSRYVLLKIFVKQVIKHYLKGTPIPILYNIREHKKYWSDVNDILAFYNTYIPHTQYVYSYNDIDLKKQDAVVVGSDQVWRKSMVPYFGLENFFLRFVPDNIKKIGYGVCIGNYEEWNDDDVKMLLPYYKRLDALSVREFQSLGYLSQNGFTFPKAQWVLDPTLLLDKDAYDSLILHGKTINMTRNKIFAYILDETDNVKFAIEKMANKNGLEVFKQNLNSSISIEQWIRNIKDSSYVITDSYHGVIFSIIYQKPFMFMGNERRGNVRIESLFALLNINDGNIDRIDFQDINKTLIKERKSSLEFLKNSLN